MPRVDVLQAFSTEPVPQDFVLPGFLVGTVGALVAPGSTGKSMLALQLACAIASDCPKANTTGLAINRAGHVLYVNLEDPFDEIKRRLYALGQHFNIMTRESVAKGLTISSRQGTPTDIMSDGFKTSLVSRMVRN